MSLGFISDLKGCASSSSAVFWDKSEHLLGRPDTCLPFPWFFPLPAADKLSATLRLHPKLASAFNNLGGRLVQLQLHKLVNYGAGN